MLGTIINTLAVIAGGVIGLIMKRGLSEKLADTVMKGLGLCTLYLGISGSLKGENSMILIISMVIGALIGQGLDLDDRINRLGTWLEGRFQSRDGQTVSIAQWLSPLLSNETIVNEMTCVGSVIIIGLALNMLGITKLKVMNYVPAIFLPILLCQFIHS